SDRRLRAGGARRRRWTYSWTVVVRFAGWLDAQVDAARNHLGDWTEFCNFGGDFWVLPARHAHVCARPGLENFAQRGGGRSEGTCRRRYSAPALEIFTAQPARRCADRILARANYRCGFVHSRCRQSRVGRYRTKTGRKLRFRNRCEPGRLRTETCAGTLSQLERETGRAPRRGAREHLF